VDETSRQTERDEERYKAAKKRVEDIKGFYVHLLVYGCVNLGLFLINVLSSPGTWWFYWPLLGWGIGLLVHGLTVFVFEGRWLGSAWEQRQIERIMSDGSGADRPQG